MPPLTDQITAHYHEDQRAKGALVDAWDLPLSYEAITPEWLTKILCEGTPEAKVESFRLGEPDNGSTNRRKIAVQYNASGRDAALPEKLFCKATHELNTRLLQGLCGALVAETTFYNDVRPLLDIEAPKAFFAKYNPYSYNSLTILEDISVRVESFCTHESPMNEARVKSQLEELAKMHSRFFQAPELETVLAKLVTWPEYFAQTKQFGMEELSNRGFLDAKEVIPPSLYKRFKDVWSKTVASTKKHNGLPQTFVHNDVHLRNWAGLPNDKMLLTDWGCCSRGHWSRDLSYTIATACTVENRRLWERDLIAYYLEKMAEGGATDITFDEAWHHYRQQMLSALAWWTMPLSPPPEMPNMHPKVATLEFIHRISTAVDDLSSMDID